MFEHKTWLYAWPILPGQEEAWRRFMQEIQELYPHEYAESRKRLGIHGESFSLASVAQAHVAILILTAAEPEKVFQRLADSEHPFDSWFKRRGLELHGIDLSQSDQVGRAQLIMTWHSPVGAPRG